MTENVLAIEWAIKGGYCQIRNQKLGIEKIEAALNLVSNILELAAIAGLAPHKMPCRYVRQLVIFLRMQAMILCGGLGTRLREETEYRPKPMVEIGGRPVLWHIMKIYAAHGITEFVLCLGYKGAMIKDYFLNYESLNNDFTLTLGVSKHIEFHNAHTEDGWKITFVETGQNTMTGGRVMRALPYIKSEHFALTYGDGLADIDVTAELDFHRKHGCQATVAAIRAPSRFGEMIIDDLEHVNNFQEKPDVSPGRINGGFFILKRAGLERYLQPAVESLIWERQPLESLARDRQLKAFNHSGYWQPMDTYREFELLNELWRSGKAPWKIW